MTRFHRSRKPMTAGQRSIDWGRGERLRRTVQHLVSALIEVASWGPTRSLVASDLGATHAGPIGARSVPSTQHPPIRELRALAPRGLSGSRRAGDAPVARAVAAGSLAREIVDRLASGPVGVCPRDYFCGARLSTACCGRETNPRR